MRGLYVRIWPLLSSNSQMITREDKLKVVPKAKNVFMFTCLGVEVTLYGTHFQYRASERSVKKFKPKPTIEIT